MTTGYFNSLLHQTNRFHVTVRLFSNRSQRTSKCRKNISDTLGCASCATFFFLPQILTSSVIYYWTDARQDGIYLLPRQLQKRSYHNITYQTLLYSWRFSHYSAPIHWLVHGHMTSNNETVSRQMPWAGNIAKTMKSNGKQFTVTREM